MTGAGFGVGLISHPDGYGRFTRQTSGPRCTVSAHSEDIRHAV